MVMICVQESFQVQTGSQYAERRAFAAAVIVQR